MLLEDAVERSNLQAAELRQRLAAIRPSTDNGEPSADLQMAMQQVREVQDAAETRAAALATTSRELVAAQDALVAAHAELEAVRQDLADAQRVVTAREEEVRQLKDQLEAKESLALELKQMQRDMAALLAGGTSAKVSPRPGSGASGPADAAALQAAATAAMRAPTEDGEAVDVLRRRTAEAQELARSAAMQAADLVQQLATSQAERQDAAARVADMREELVKLRSSAQGELVVRIEALERDLVVARNRADVNALFRDEHERIAGDLIATKLALAEAQEQLVVLRRSLVKSQERSMSFASKLTSLETKLYRRLSNAAVRIRGGSNNGSTSSEAEIDAALGDVSKQDTSGSSRRRGKARKA